MIWEDEGQSPGADVTLQLDTAMIIAGKCRLWSGIRDDGNPSTEATPECLQCIAFCLAGMY